MNDKNLINNMMTKLGNAAANMPVGRDCIIFLLNEPTYPTELLTENGDEE